MVAGSRRRSCARLRRVSGVVAFCGVAACLGGGACVSEAPGSELIELQLARRRPIGAIFAMTAGSVVAAALHMGWLPELETAAFSDSDAPETEVGGQCDIDLTFWHDVRDGDDLRLDVNARAALLPPGDDASGLPELLVRAEARQGGLSLLSKVLPSRMTRPVANHWDTQALRVSLDYAPLLEGQQGTMPELTLSPLQSPWARALEEVARGSCASRGCGPKQLYDAIAASDTSLDRASMQGESVRDSVPEATVYLAELPDIPWLDLEAHSYAYWLWVVHVSPEARSVNIAVFGVLPGDLLWADVEERYKAILPVPAMPPLGNPSRSPADRDGSLPELSPPSLEPSAPEGDAAQATVPPRLWDPVRRSKVGFSGYSGCNYSEAR